MSSATPLVVYRLAFTFPRGALGPKQGFLHELQDLLNGHLKMLRVAGKNRVTTCTVISSYVSPVEAGTDVETKEIYPRGACRVSVVCVPDDGELSEPLQDLLLEFASHIVAHHIRQCRSYDDGNFIFTRAHKAFHREESK